MMDEIKFSPTIVESIRFTEDIAEIFLANVVRCPEAAISDESLIIDFSCVLDYNLEHAIRPGSKPGFYIFHKVLVHRRSDGLTYAEFLAKQPPQPEEIEVRSRINWRAAMIRRTQRVFGVDIESVFDKLLPEVFLHIARHGGRAYFENEYKGRRR